jgi:hypothetical protein
MVLINADNKKIEYFDNKMAKAAWRIGSIAIYWYNILPQ